MRTLRFMTPEAPIIIVGTGRCGSTIYQQLFAEHPRVAWLSEAARNNPARPQLNRRALERRAHPLWGRLYRHRVNPGEHYAFWEHYCPGFSRTFRDLLASDVTERNKKILREAFGAIAWKERPRLLIKITGWPKMGFLREVFPDARFIHVVRDGRAVVNSHLNVPFWKGWEGPENWRWGPLPEKYRDEWEHSGRSFVVLGCIQWKILMDAFMAAKALVPDDQFFEFRYEDFCARPLEMYRESVEFAGLEWTPDFEAVIRGANIRSKNTKWGEDLTEEQRELVEQSLAGHLREWGYEENK